MSRQNIVKQGAFDADVAGQINANFAELYAASVGGALPSAKIIVGDGGGVAAAVDMSGDATIDDTGAVSIADGITTHALLAGVAAGYKIARGEHQQAAASDTVVTGLATVVAVVIAPRTRTIKQLFFNASIGDQAGTPAAGSFLLTSQKPTAVNDVTPIAATDFTDNIKVNWIAIGT